jgi:16S rRNA (guanine1207-N2)-methyltransferase
MLLQAATRRSGSPWLVLGGEAELVLALAAALHRSRIEWQPVDHRQVAAVPSDSSTISVCPVETGHQEAEGILLPVPPDRGLARRWLLVARQRLAPGGTLLVAGANAEGIRSVIADATALFGSPEFERFGQKQRIAAFVAPSVAAPPDLGWAGERGIAPGSWAPLTIETGHDSLSLVTRAGVFAGARLDAGTRLLLDALPVPISGSVLDVGCGVGAIGIVAAMRGADSVVLSDVNLLAIAATRQNAHDLNLPQCEVVAGDVYAGLPGRQFDLIVSNPPFHHGKAVDFSVADRLIGEAPQHLESGGRLLLVANAFLAYGKRMQHVFRQVETVVSTRQFHVLAATEPR